MAIATTTHLYNKHDYVQKLRSRINKPTTWSDVLKVTYSDIRTIVNGYWITEPPTDTNTRATAYSYQNYETGQDTLTIDQSRVLPVFIDEADRAQQNYVSMMGIADYQGKKVNEYIESVALAAAISGTNFGVTDLSNTGADDATAITVSAANIDDIIRAVKRKIYENNGVDFAVERGIFFVWRPEDFELLEAFVQANGFTEADISLKNGIPVQKAFRYMGVDHYLSTQHTANHVFAGIKKTMELGILRSTYGRVKYIEDPSQTSGLGIVTRLDWGFNLPAYNLEFIIDVNVA